MALMKKSGCQKRLKPSAQSGGSEPLGITALEALERHFNSTPAASAPPCTGSRLPLKHQELDHKKDENVA